MLLNIAMWYKSFYPNKKEVLSVILILSISLFAGCSNLPFKCIDGWEASNYLPKDTVINVTKAGRLLTVYSHSGDKIEISKELITVEELKAIAGDYIDSHTLPVEIKENIVAWATKGCGGSEYSIKQDNEFKKVTKWKLKIFVKQYNNSCNGCLTIIRNGCC